MIRSSSSVFWNTTRPCTRSSTTTSPSSGLRKRITGVHARARLVSVAAAAVVARLLLARQLLRRAWRPARPWSSSSDRRCPRPAFRPAPRGIAVVALRLVVRTLVGVEAEPLHALEDDAHRFFGGALAIGVLHPQDELAAVVPRVQPGKQRRAHAADVQHAGGTGGETGNDRRGAHWTRVPAGKKDAHGSREASLAPLTIASVWRGP